MTYTPDAGGDGADSFTYRASDGDLESSPATVALDVEAPPEVMLAADRTAVRQGVGDRVTRRPDASDPDGTVEEYRFTVDGSVVQTGASATLSRSFQAVGAHTVQVRVKDDDGRTATASRSVNVTAAPVTPGPPPGGGGGGGGSGAARAAAAPTSRPRRPR